MAATELWTLELGEPGYPAALHDLDGVRAGQGRAAEGAPAALHGCGDRSLVAGLRLAESVTIVGARRCTPYGRRIAEELAGSLASAGLLVISGMAFGIDAAAHRGALAAGAPTLAVLGGGPDVPYPPSARGLHAQILAAGGAVISESPPGRPAARWDFPARNRIMAALGAMTIMVEATERSGSRITADRALQLDREVGAVPGSIHSPLSAGPHALLRDGALLVDGAQDVLDRLLGVGAVSAHRVGPALEPELADVLGVIDPAGSTGEAVAAACSLPAAGVAVALARLELLGYLRCDAGRYAPTALAPPEDTCERPPGPGA